jgi:hypothetical protein
MATRSLSPKQIQERIQQHRQAVMVLALMRAKKAINAKLKAQGVRVTQCCLRSSPPRLGITSLSIATN